MFRPFPETKRNPADRNQQSNKKPIQLPVIIHSDCGLPASVSLIFCSYKYPLIAW
jgi:hypothetical protein